MAVTATINGTQVTIKVGWVLRDHYNEVLDGGTIVIPQTNEINIRPYDEVVLSGSPLTATKTYLVAHYSKRQIAFTPVAKYEYSVSLVSKTIKLQRTFLPNVSITQPVTGAGITVAQAIQQYVNVYGEKYWISGANVIANVWSLSSNITALTALVPEFTLSKPTLFELFNTILARENKIITLRGDNVLDVINLTTKFNAIDTSKLTYIEQTENASEYLSELELEFFNVLSDDKNSDAGFDLPIETTVRANDSVLNTENLALILEKPIYKIISVKYLHGTEEDQQAGDVAYKEFDITPYVVERTEYELLTTNPLNAGTKKYHRIYYTQGSNQISGLMYRPYTAMPEAIYQIASLATGGSITLGVATGGLPFASTYGIGRWLFRVKYIPQNDAKMRTSKYKGVPYSATTIDGQKANYGNLDLIADEQFKNAQRIGQPEITITASRYTSESQVPKLGDFYGDYIVTSREISWNDGFIIFRGTLAKDYVNKTMFTGITSKRRLYEIASGAESVSRHDLIKIYYEFSRIQKTPKTSEDIVLTGQFARLFIAGTDDLKPVAVILRTYDTFQIQSYAMLKETIEQAAGNSVLWSFEMQDNYSVGIKQDGAITGGTALRQVSYVNSNGQFRSIFMNFVNKAQLQTKYQIPAKIGQVLVTWGSPSQQAFMDYTTATNLSNYVAKFQALPEIPTSDIPSTDILDIYKTLYKDNREITKITVQHELVADDLDIVVGKQMAKTSRLFKTTATTRFFYFYTGTSRYNIYDNFTVLTSSQPINLTTNSTIVTYSAGTNTNRNARIDINILGFESLTNFNWNQITAWAIGTGANELIIGVNKKSTDSTIPSTIWLNIIENRYI
jgi:hypothetical protein